MNIEADRTPGTTNRIFCGNISARKSIIYPVYLEARLKMNQLPMGSDFWMISRDQTQEIDILEAFGTTRPEYNWFTKRLHLSHHTFDRTNGGFKDYQPSDNNGVEGTWYHRNNVARWSASEFTLGVYWRDPFHLEYYLNGKLIRTMDKNSYSYIGPNGQKINKTTTFNAIDKFNYTKGTGLNKPMFILIDTGIQPWTNMTVTTAELNDPVKSVYKVNWVRAYKPVNSPTGGGNTGNTVQLTKRNANGFSIDGGNGAANGQNVYLWGRSPSNNNQKWVEINRGNGFFSYQKKGTNHCLDGGVGGANGQNVKLWKCDGNNQNQHWQKINVGNNSFRLAKRNALAFSIDGGIGGANGQNLTLWFGNNNNQNQHWSFANSSKNLLDDNKELINEVPKVNLYPNPASEVINIEGLEDGESYTVSIISMTGQKLLAQSFVQKGNNYQLNTVKLPAGTYILSVSGKMTNSKLMLVIK